MYAPQPETKAVKNRRFLRPSISTLVLVYAVWLAALITLSFSSAFPNWTASKFLLLGLSWLPAWAWLNWDDVTHDLPAVWATFAIGALMAFYLSAYIFWGVRDTGFAWMNQYFQMGRRGLALLNASEFLLHITLLAGFRRLWSRLYAKLKASQRSL